MSFADRIRAMMAKPAAKIVEAQHVTSVQRSGTMVDGKLTNAWGYYASCSCGWASPPKHFESGATEAAADHSGSASNSPAELAGRRRVLSVERPGEPTDLGKLARAALRAKRSKCTHARTRLEHGREVCRDCHDRFPCSGDRCEHVDCIERGVELGFRTGFPRSYSHDLIILGHGHRGGDDCPGCAIAPEDHYEYLVDTSLPPTKWITGIQLEKP